MVSRRGFSYKAAMQAYMTRLLPSDPEAIYPRILLYTYDEQP